jgi:hypothetical protein
MKDARDAPAVYAVGILRCLVSLLSADILRSLIKQCLLCSVFVMLSADAAAVQFTASFTARWYYLGCCAFTVFPCAAVC